MVPDGTATFFNTMVAHDACDLLAEAYPFDPLKVQLDARFSIAPAAGAAVTAGAGAAAAETARATTPKRRDEDTIVLVSLCSKPKESAREYKRRGVNGR